MIQILILLVLVGLSFSIY